MTLGTGKTSSFSTKAKRFGYAVAVGIHVLLLVVANNLLDWGWFPSLTPEFDELLPIRGGPQVLDSLAASLRWSPVLVVMPPFRGFGNRGAAPSW